MVIRLKWGCDKGGWLLWLTSDALAGNNETGRFLRMFSTYHIGIYIGSEVNRTEN